MRTAKTDQTGWMPRLIWDFAGHICHFVLVTVFAKACPSQYLRSLLFSWQLEKTEAEKEESEASLWKDMEKLVTEHQQTLDKTREDLEAEKQLAVKQVHYLQYIWYQAFSLSLVWKKGLGSVGDPVGKTYRAWLQACTSDRVEVNKFQGNCFDMADSS